MSMENAYDIPEISKTWDKIETTSKTTGLREGIAAGRESNFQKYFDIGFKEGFKTGYVLGKYKGLLAAHSKQNSSELVKYPLLEKTSKGACEACNNEELLEQTVTVVIEKQTDVSNQYVNELYCTFHKTFNCESLQKLDDM